MTVMRLLSVWILCGLVFSGASWAHGAGYEQDTAANAVVLRFHYSIGEPMSDTDVVVTAPDGTEWSRGRSDRDGRFGFVPAEPGLWRAVADDGLGHEVRAEITVGAEGAVANQATTRVGLPPMLLYGLLLASLVGNAAWLIPRLRQPQL
jgi:hypothetical protein